MNEILGSASLYTVHKNILAITKTFYYTILLLHIYWKNLYSSLHQSWPKTRWNRYIKNKRRIITLWTLVQTSQLLFLDSINIFNLDGTEDTSIDRLSDSMDLFTCVEQKATNMYWTDLATPKVVAKPRVHISPRTGTRDTAVNNWFLKDVRHVNTLNLLLKS